MKEIITSMKENIALLESTLGNTPEEQQTDLKVKLMRIDKDLRGVVLLQLAINK